MFEYDTSGRAYFFFLLEALGLDLGLDSSSYWVFHFFLLSFSSEALAAIVATSSDMCPMIWNKALT
ncbi:conserved hypothetical protein [Ricinus communis]|uniref:Uncharacterized protein n=1 Tax=Ricinus communis TaxID=3988 RepID=B9RPG7_RICCO|nr:conserved hypothetical protein [Ricinus communis]